MTDRTHRKRAAKYRRAKIRSFIFTVGPNRLTGGRISRRHQDKDVVVREIEVSSPHWPAKFDGLRIGHVSDFHLGELLSLPRALQVIEQLRDQGPDLIACTGDVVDLHHHDAGPLFEAIAKAQAPLGAAVVLGNHDELHCPDTIARLARDSGLLMLQNEAVEIHHDRGTLSVGGIHWAKTADGCARHVDQTCGEGVDLLLAHNPRAFMRAAELEIPLTLAGHTHGGQIAMTKSRRNANLALGHRHRAGLFAEGPSRLYVTSGVGAWFPLRVNCPAEIAMITMKHAPAAAQAPVEPDSPRRRRGKRTRHIDKPHQ